jgi:hypothetical protein
MNGLIHFARIAFQQSLLFPLTVYLATLDLLLLTNTPAATISYMDEWFWFDGS